MKDIKHHGPIILLEDNPEHYYRLRQAAKELELSNEVTWFRNTRYAAIYMQMDGEQPFMILCNTKLDGQSPIEFKKVLDADPVLRLKSIPFIFYSEKAEQEMVDAIYSELIIQGFFNRSNEYERLKHNLKLASDYWQACRHPTGYSPGRLEVAGSLCEN